MSVKVPMSSTEKSAVVGSAQPGQRLRVEFTDRILGMAGECEALAHLVANLASPKPELRVEEGRLHDMQLAAHQRRFQGSRTYYFMVLEHFRSFGVLRRACSESVVHRLWKV